MLAAARTKAGMLRGLLAHGAAVDAADGRGMTALMQAAERGRVEAVKALLQAGADPARLDTAGRTAADFARDNRQNYILALLGARSAR